MATPEEQERQRLGLTDLGLAALRGTRPGNGAAAALGLLSAQPTLTPAERPDYSPASRGRLTEGVTVSHLPDYGDPGNPNYASEFDDKRKAWYARHPSPSAPTTTPASPLPPEPRMGIQARANSVVQEAIERRRAPELQGPSYGIPLALPAQQEAMAKQRAVDAQRQQLAARPAAPVAERGNYNMQNTDLAALRNRAAPTAGINFGFGADGGESARQYLDRMDAKDAQASAARQARQQGYDDYFERRRYEEQMLSDDPFARRAGRTQLDAMNQRTVTGMQNDGALTRAQLEAQSRLQGLGIQGEYGLDERELANQGALDVAQLGMQKAAMEGQAGYGLELLKAQLKAQSPEAQLAAERARVLQDNRALALGASTTGADPQTVSALRNGRSLQTPAGEVVFHPITGAPIGMRVGAGVRPFTATEDALFNPVSQ